MTIRLFLFVFHFIVSPLSDFESFLHLVVTPPTNFRVSNRHSVLAAFFILDDVHLLVAPPSRCRDSSVHATAHHPTYCVYLFLFLLVVELLIPSSPTSVRYYTPASVTGDRIFRSGNPWPAYGSAFLPLSVRAIHPGRYVGLETRHFVASLHSSCAR